MTIGDALNEKSELRHLVQDGLGGLKKPHRQQIDEAIRENFDDSLDLDEAMRPNFPNDHRWDYLVGYEPEKKIIAIEVHTANSKHVKDIIGKKQSAINQLGRHLSSHNMPSRWLWVASGKTDIPRTSPEHKRLANKNIYLVGSMVRKGDLG